MSTEQEGTVDVDRLPLAEYLILDVLAARWRLGEQLWTFPSRCRNQVARLAGLGLVHEMSGNVPKTVRAALTEKGRAAVLSDEYRPPTVPERVTVVVVHDEAGEVIPLSQSTWQSIAQQGRYPGVLPDVRRLP